MLPEIISNGLASLQPDGCGTPKPCSSSSRPTALAWRPIRIRRRSAAAAGSRMKKSMSYLADREAWQSRLTPRSACAVGPDARAGDDPARRGDSAAGARIDDEGSQSRSGSRWPRVGAHVVENTESHQIIEEFMLAANEAVAEIAACRRLAVSPPRAFRSRSAQAQGAGRIRRRAGLSKPKACKAASRCNDLLNTWSNGKPEQHAVNYAVLRSLQRADLQPGGRWALRAGQRLLLPFHVADPPLSRSDDPPAARTALLHGKKSPGTMAELARAGRALLRPRTPGRSRRARADEAQAADLSCKTASARRWTRRHRRRRVRPVRRGHSDSGRRVGPRHVAGRRPLSLRPHDAHADRPSRRQQLSAGRPGARHRGPGRCRPPRIGFQAGDPARAVRPPAPSGPQRKGKKSGKSKKRHKRWLPARSPKKLEWSKLQLSPHAFLNGGVTPTGLEPVLPA